MIKALNFADLNEPMLKIRNNSMFQMQLYVMLNLRVKLK